MVVENVNYPLLTRSGPATDIERWVPRDIAECLGTRDFWRLRIGIGHPRDTATEQEVVDYVLHPPRAEEQPLIDNALARGLEVWPLIAVDQYEAAMLKLHTKENKTP